MAKKQSGVLSKTTTTSSVSTLAQKKISTTTGTAKNLSVKPS